MKKTHILTLLLMLTVSVAFGQTPYKLNYPDIAIGNSPTGKIVLNGSNLRLPRIATSNSPDSLIGLVDGKVVKIKSQKQDRVIYLSDYSDTYTGYDGTTGHNEGSAIVKAYNSITDTTKHYTILFEPNKTYFPTGFTLDHPWIKPNISLIGTKPRYATDGKSLVSGTVILGTFAFFANSLYFDGLGIDAGVNYCANYGFPDGTEAFITSFNPAQSAIIERNNVIVKNIITLCKPNTIFHGISTEFVKVAVLDNITTLYGYHGQVIKAKKVKFTNGFAYGHNGEGVIIKSDGYAPSDDVTIDGFTVDSLPPGVTYLEPVIRRYGVLINPATADVYNVKLNNITINNYQNGIAGFGGYTVHGLQIDNVTTNNTNIAIDNELLYANNVQIGKVGVTNASYGYRQIDSNFPVSLSSLSLKNVVYGMSVSSGSVYVNNYIHDTGNVAFDINNTGSIYTGTVNLTGVGARTFGTGIDQPLPQFTAIGAGIMKNNANGIPSIAVAGTDYVVPSAINNFLPKSAGSGNALTGPLYIDRPSTSSGGSQTILSAALAPEWYYGTDIAGSLTTSDFGLYNFGIGENAFNVSKATNLISIKSALVRSLIGTGDRPVVTDATGTLKPGIPLSLTTTGTSGAATFNSGTNILNIPNYSASATTSTQVPEYLVDKVGSTITATPKPGSGLATFTGTDLMVVVQSAVDALSVPGAPPTGRGGTVKIGRGNFTTTNEVTIKGFETFGSGNVDPQSQVRIIGTGGATFINQTAAGKNLFVVKDRASGAIEDMFLAISNSSALSAIYIKGNDANEIGAHRFKIDNIRVNSSSTVAEAIKMQNFFAVDMPWISVYQTGYTNMSLENISPTTNYGNSHFGEINLISPNNNAYSALSITSTNNHPMNLNLFDAVYIGGQYGQANGRGIYMKGGSYNTFTKVDIEYTANTIVLDGVSGTTETTANSFLKGYLYPSDGGTGISIVESGNGNTFDNFKIEGDNANIQLINDLQRFRPSNSFTNFYFGVTVSPSTKINILSASETPLSYTQNGTEIRYSDRTFRVGASDATGDIYFRDADQRINRLAVGATGQVLTVAGGKPTWAASSGGGGGVTSITGTSNQVIASASTGAITLSLPQSIHTGAFPRFAGQGIGTAADGVNLLKLAGGSTTGAPLLFTSGALTTGLANGRFEYDGSRWYGTAAGVRQTFAYSSDLANYAPINSPTFTGTPKAPNPSTTSITDNQIATTTFTGIRLNFITSGTGSATTISVPHGLTGVTSSSFAIAQAKNAASSGISYVTTDATNINIVYSVAPAAGTNNLYYSIEIRP